jgi:hypothetical protein
MPALRNTALALALACGPIGPVATDTSSTVDTTTSPPTSTADTTTSPPTSTADTPICPDDGLTTGAPPDPSDLEAALALECISRSKSDCQQPVPEGSPGRCVWMNAQLFPPCTTTCAAAVASAVCVTMRYAEETGCYCACQQDWYATPECIYVIPPPGGDAFCFDFPVGWKYCSPEHPHCTCCDEPCI